MPGVPAARDDKRLLVVTGVFVVLAAVLFAGVLLIATNANSGSQTKKPVFIGLRSQIAKNIRQDGPRYQANPFGDAGFWLDLEGDTLVAYVLDVPGHASCVIRWKAQQDEYVDCDSNPVDPAALDRYAVLLGPREGSPPDSVFVDLRRVLPAPGGGGATG
jgi:hypothetical protein